MRVSSIVMTVVTAFVGSGSAFAATNGWGNEKSGKGDFHGE